MMRVFGEDGAHVPVTVLDLAGCQVIGRRTVDAEEFKNSAGEAVALKPKKSRKNEKNETPAREAKGDGYTALQLAAGDDQGQEQDPSRARSVRARQGRAESKSSANSASPPTTCCRSAPVISAEHFVPGQKVDVAGISIGKGFAGAMKRWNFGGLRATHGVSVSHRSHGSTGQRQDPGKVFKGKKMAGHLGDERVSIQNLQIVRVDAERGLLFVRGAVPGAENSWVEVRDAAKVALPKEAPKPAASRQAASGG